MANRDRYFNSTITATIANPGNALGAPDGTVAGTADKTAVSGNWDFSVEAVGTYTGDHTIVLTVGKNASGGGDATLDSVVIDVNGSPVTPTSAPTLPLTLTGDPAGTLDTATFVVANADIAPGDTLDITIGGTGGGGGPNERGFVLDGATWTVDYSTGSNVTPQVGVQSFTLTQQAVTVDTVFNQTVVVGIQSITIEAKHSYVNEYYQTPSPINAYEETNEVSTIGGTVTTEESVAETGGGSSYVLSKGTQAGAAYFGITNNIGGQKMPVGWYEITIKLSFISSIGDVALYGSQGDRFVYEADGIPWGVGEAFKDGTWHTLTSYNYYEGYVGTNDGSYRVWFDSETLTGDTLYLDQFSIKPLFPVYSANNLYTPANALNADNISFTLGNITDQTNDTSDLSVVKKDTPSQYPTSPYSVRLNTTASQYERIEIQLALDGVTLDTSKNYIVKVWYKRVVGATTTGNGFSFAVRTSGGNSSAATGDGAFETITEANTGTWTQWTSSAWSPTETQPDLWFVGSWNEAVTADDFYITNLEILEASVDVTVVLGVQSITLTQQTVNVFTQDDSILVTDPVLYLRPSTIDPDVTIDGNALSDTGEPAWADRSSNGLTTTMIGTNPLALNIDASAGRQVTFDGTNGLDISDDASIDFTPGTDEFSLVLREGSDDTAQGYWIAKADDADTGRQYTAVIRNTTLRVVIGGTEQIATVPAGPNRLVILNVSTTGVDAWVDGTQYLTAASIGTNTATNSLNVGCRTDAAGGQMIGDLDIVAIIPKVISTAEREAIEAEFQINGGNQTVNLGVQSITLTQQSVTVNTDWVTTIGIQSYSLSVLAATVNTDWTTIVGIQSYTLSVLSATASLGNTSVVALQTYNLSVLSSTANLDWVNVVEIQSYNLTQVSVTTVEGTGVNVATAIQSFSLSVL